MEDFLLNLHNYGVTINLTQIISIDKVEDGTAVIRMNDGSVIPTQEKYQHFLDTMIPERFFVHQENENSESKEKVVQSSPSKA